MSDEQNYISSAHVWNVAAFQALPTITLTSPDGRSAVIDFGGEEVAYSGDLPVSEGARQLFDAVGAHLQHAYNISRQ